MVGVLKPYGQTKLFNTRLIDLSDGRVELAYLFQQMHRSIRIVILLICFNWKMFFSCFHPCCKTRTLEYNSYFKL